METETPKVINEFIAGPDDKVWKVVKPFFLEVKLGPLTRIEKNSSVRLTPSTALELFHAARVEPVELGETFEMVRAIRMAQNGEWVDLVPGDIVKLTREEALLLLRRGEIREKKGEI